MSSEPAKDKGLTDGQLEALAEGDGWVQIRARDYKAYRDELMRLAHAKVAPFEEYEPWKVAMVTVAAIALSLAGAMLIGAWAGTISLLYRWVSSL